KRWRRAEVVAASDTDTTNSRLCWASLTDFASTVDRSGTVHMRNELGTDTDYDVLRTSQLGLCRSVSMVLGVSNQAWASPNIAREFGLSHVTFKFVPRRLR